jgi:hypothetical protein
VEKSVEIMLGLWRRRRRHIVGEMFHVPSTNGPGSKV